MKKIDTFFSTISYESEGYGNPKKRLFLTENAARKNAIKDMSNTDFELYINDRYIDESNRIFTKTTLIAKIVSGKMPTTFYYQLCGVDEDNNEYPLKAFNRFKTAKIQLPSIDKEHNYNYYNVYLVTEKLIDNKPVLTYEFFATLPSKKTKVVNYYGITATNEFDIERQINGFKSLQEIENYNLIPQEKHINYQYDDILLIFDDYGIIEKKYPIKQINNSKTNAKTRKKRKK